MKAKLLLKNGRIFEGLSVGSNGTVYGEICSCTAMTGYQEILTDENYSGKIVVFTYPEIGNYGICADEMPTNQAPVKALIMKNFCQQESHYKSTENLGTFLNRKEIIAISNVDTREITSIIRKEGAMPCLVTTEDISNEMKNKLNIWQADKNN